MADHGDNSTVDSQSQKSIGDASDISPLTTKRPPSGHQLPISSSKQSPIASEDIEIEGEVKSESRLNYESDQYKRLSALETCMQFKAGAIQLFHEPRKYFQLEERNTTVFTEFKGGFATFLTMSYILAVNPNFLGIWKDKNAVLTATAMSAALCNILMGLFTNFPITIAAGMGLNAYIAFTVLPDSKGDWSAAMGLVVLDGFLILFLVLVGLREAVLNSIPEDIKRAISVGIGFFIAFIGFIDAKVVRVPESSWIVLTEYVPTANETFMVSLDAGKCQIVHGPAVPPVGPSSFQEPEVIVCMLGLMVTAIMLNRKWPGAVIVGIVFSTLVALCFDLVAPLDFKMPDFSLFFDVDVTAPFKKGNQYMWGHLLSFTMVDFFDTLGTMTACSSKAKLTSKKGRIPNSTGVLIIDSISAIIGGLFGASSNTAYIECCTGICQGARTGLHSIFVGLFFLFAVVLAPIVAIVPQCATAPALILIGFMMSDQIGHIKFDIKHYETGIPAFLIILLTPMTYSIAHGIGYGFIAYVVIMVGSKKYKEVDPLMYICSLIFVFFFIFAKI